MAFNGTLMVVSFVWLAMYNLAMVSLMGIFGLILGPSILPFLLVPGTICAEIMGRFPRAKFISWVRVPAALGFTLPLTAYACAMFYLGSGAMMVALVPTVAWACGASLMPWLIYARKHDENQFLTALLLVMQICIVAIMFIGIYAKLNIFYWFAMMWVLSASSFTVILFGQPRLLEQARTISS